MQGYQLFTEIPVGTFFNSALKYLMQLLIVRRIRMKMVLSA